MESRSTTQNWPEKRKSGWVYAGKERAYRVGLHQQDDEPLGHLLIIPDVVLLANVEEGLVQQAADILTFHMIIRSDPMLKLPLNEIYE